MSYRDDLTAAQARADAAMQSLAEERESREEDATHIASLEATLAESLRDLAELRRDATPPPTRAPAASAASSSSGCGLSVFVFVLVVGLGAFIVMSLGGSDDSPSYDTSTSTRPGMPEFDPSDFDGIDITPDFLKTDSELGALLALAEPEPARPTPSEFDVSGGILQAREMAANYFGDDIVGAPYLVGLHASGVDDEGKSHLIYGEVTYSFSVERPPAPPTESASPENTAPIGARPPSVPEVDTRSCRVEITVDESGIRAPRDYRRVALAIKSNRMKELYGEDDFGSREMKRQEGSCKLPKIETRCRISEIHRRAVKRGAPAMALATVSIGKTRNPDCDAVKCTDSPRNTCCRRAKKGWKVTVVDRGDTLFDKFIPDACKRSSASKE